ncbi:hypothetical protein [Microbacterium saperdae]|uniref:Uncharacterized protein n=1 Tax=Microbacterium saperdae TaxID=69368 RepID=A0A543BQY2_9MICO|nr:hypothetical protein [Microbacterium saperdae]TQL87232.1 hypothetical protein FB560_2899 [Microbacterium saperdae]GGM41926.1 hypothetical protein GCM10010489_11170 [Microbacterium saperdae]
MNFDWLWPLLVGSALTFGATTLEGLRSRKHQDRRDAREQLAQALDLATKVGAEISTAQSKLRFTYEAVDPGSASFTELAAIEAKLPDARVREAVRCVGYVLNVAQAAQRLDAWDEYAGHVQRGAIGRLRSILGSAVRGERAFPAADLDWLNARCREAEVAFRKAYNS